MAVPKYPLPVVGGLERQAHELSKALVARGHAVHVLSGRFDPVQRTIDIIDGVSIHRLPWSEFKLQRFLQLSFSLMRILVKFGPTVDLVHVHNISWFGAFITLFAKILGLPVLTKLPNIGEFGIPGIRQGPLGLLRIALLKSSDAIIAMTPDSVAELAGINYPATRILKVTNGISRLPINSRRSYPSASSTVCAIFVGRLMSQKGLADLLHAWAMVKARAAYDAKLRLIGEGPQKDELKALAQALNLGESVEFCGFCADVPAELAQADLFVLPSLAEGNSNAILEAMRAGLPIVTTNVGGAAIQVGNEGEGFLCNPGDREALARHLMTLIADQALRDRLGAAMRSRVESIFAIDQVAAVYEQAYQLLIAGHRQQIGQINPNLFEPRTKGTC
ncbi:MAG: glycosyltransferase family 4 protein [Candidatus Contendobacter sp.]|nr:glycosyltransferase family 4 protein [Candidatus Contendobacter sp.]